MRVAVIDEHGYRAALLGLGLSHGVTSGMVLHTLDTGRVEAVARRLCDKDQGHNKYLESICVWLDITMPRYWWQEFDTYRVGTTKQSESTMHTLTKRPLGQDDFCSPIPTDFLELLNSYVSLGDWVSLKALLPEGFLQRRIVCTNYKVLRHIIIQRRNHRLHEWKSFCAAVKAAVMHPELLP